MELVTVQTFNNFLEANMACSALENEHIECVLFDEHIMDIDPADLITSGGIKLKVQSQDAQRAIDLLQKNKHERFNDSAYEVILCPKCGSDHLTRQAVETTNGMFAFLISLFDNVFVTFTNPKYQCLNCNEKFAHKTIPLNSR